VNGTGSRTTYFDATISFFFGSATFFVAALRGPFAAAGFLEPLEVATVFVTFGDSVVSFEALARVGSETRELDTAGSAGVRAETGDVADVEAGAGAQGGRPEVERTAVGSWETEPVPEEEAPEMGEDTSTPTVVESF
jgi:hypothetical protein